MVLMDQNEKEPGYKIMYVHVHISHFFTVFHICEYKFTCLNIFNLFQKPAIKQKFRDTTK